MLCGDPNLATWVAVDLAGQHAADSDLYDRGQLAAVPWAEAERRLSGLDDGLFIPGSSTSTTTARSAISGYVGGMDQGPALWAA